MIALHIHTRVAVADSLVARMLCCPVPIVQQLLKSGTQGPTLA